MPKWAFHSGRFSSTENHMNHLQHETSPYLLQHAHNPVDWYAWKPEAFEKAKREDKPILVSIGYSTCHWCHVMERESFEDAEVAGYMNDNFVCIKVDREERPDVDQIYMEACQVFSGGGGWPLNCFLLPDGRPFFAGTYYPPMPAHNRPSWLQVLMNLAHAYQKRRETVEGQAARLMEIIQNTGKTFTENKLKVVGDEPALAPVHLHRIFESLQKQFDNVHGGFGGAPKFPGAMSLDFLLAYHFYFGEKKALDHALLSLRKMAMGGIYDHLGGGFARYATDSKWLVPHFEKMLYDNALLVGVLANAYKLTRDPFFKTTAQETLDWATREMMSAEYGFYSAQDADSEGVEGKFYVWQKKEITQALGPDADLFCAYYEVTDHGNWEETNILWRKWDLPTFANAKGMEVHVLEEKLKAARQTLFNLRERRVHPGLDDKLLLDWNALMCSAFAQASAAFGEPGYGEIAVKNLRFILDKLLQADGISLYHTYKDGKAQYDAFLDDYAFLIEAMLNVAEISADHHWILQAGRYISFVLENFFDPSDKMFYFTSAKQSDIPMRRKDFYDSATPSGNSTMVRNLQRGGLLLGREDWRQLASGMLISMQDAIVRYPSSFSRWAESLAAEVFGLYEVALVGDRAHVLLKEVSEVYLPNRVVMATIDENNDFPLLRGKTVQAHTLIYMCQDYACQKPVATIAEFKQSVASVHS